MYNIGYKKGDLELLILFGVFVIDFFYYSQHTENIIVITKRGQSHSSASCIHIYIMFQTIRPVLVSFSIFAGLPHVEEK